MNNEERILELMEQHQKMLETINSDVSDLKSDVSDLKARITKIEVTQENIIIPNIQALAEGQKTILETLAPKNRVEALEDDVAFLKTVIKAMNQEINDLKKAQ